LRTHLDQRMFALTSVAIGFAVKCAILTVTNDCTSAQTNFVAAFPFAIFASAEKRYFIEDLEIQSYNCTKCDSFA
jgi:hypothetical protein